MADWKEKITVALLIFAAAAAPDAIAQNAGEKDAGLLLKDCMVLEKGEHYFREDFELPVSKTLLIKPGAHIKMGDGVRLEIRGRIIAAGTPEEPVVFEGDKGRWRGIYILGRQAAPDIEEYRQAFDKNTFERSNFMLELAKGHFFVNCEFRGLSTDSKRNVLNRKKAAIEAVNAVVLVENCRFSDVVHLGCIQVQNGILWLGNNLFDSRLVMKMIHLMDSVLVAHNNRFAPQRYEHQTWPDAIYVDKGMGFVAYNEFDGIPDDAVDFDGALAVIFNNTVTKTFDDGFDIDNGTEAYIASNSIDKVSEHGVLISNGASAVLLDNEISQADAGLTLRNGGFAVVDSLKISGCKTGVLLFDQPPPALETSDFELVRKRMEVLSDADLDWWGFYLLKSSEEAVVFLDSLYSRCCGYMILNGKDKVQDSMNIFKVVDVLSFKDIAMDAQRHIENGFCSLGAEKRDRIASVFEKFRKSVFITHSFIDADYGIIGRGFWSLASRDTKFNGVLNDSGVEPDGIEEKLNAARRKIVYARNLLEFLKKEADVLTASFCL